MKKFKKITIALASMLLMFSMASAVTGTVAWFTAANTVSVSGMNIQAETEQGIVISNEDKAVWKTSAIAKYNGEIDNPAHATDPSKPEKIQARFVPTSNAADSTHWYHGYAANADNGQDGEVVEEVTASQVATTGVYKFTENTIDKNIYLLNKFYIKSSGNADVTGQDIYVKSVKAVLLNGGTAATQALSRALRILIKATGTGGKGFVFAPIANATATYKVGVLAEGAADSRADFTAITTINTANNYEATELTNVAGVDIPAYNSASPLEFEVYAYFEGEDEACKSSNIPAAELEKLAVSFELANKVHD